MPKDQWANARNKKRGEQEVARREYNERERHRQKQRKLRAELPKENNKRSRKPVSEMDIFMELLRSATTHERLNRIAHRLAECHRATPIRGYEQIVNFGRARRAEVDKAIQEAAHVKQPDLDAEYQSIVKQ